MTSSGHSIRPAIAVCWFQAFGWMEHGDPMSPCDGALVRCHLIPKRMIRERGGDVWDRRAWVWGCGGLQGNAGHHGMFDHSRTLRLARGALPHHVEELAEELGLGWWLDRTYGPRTTEAAA